MYLWAELSRLGSLDVFPGDLTHTTDLWLRKQARKTGRRLHRRLIAAPIDGTALYTLTLEVLR